MVCRRQFFLKKYYFIKKLLSLQSFRTNEMNCALVCVDIDSNRMLKMSCRYHELRMAPYSVGGFQSLSISPTGVLLPTEISKQSALAVSQYHRDNQHQSPGRPRYALA